MNALGPQRTFSKTSRALLLRTRAENVCEVSSDQASPASTGTVPGICGAGNRAVVLNLRRTQALEMP